MGKNQVGARARNAEGEVDTAEKGEVPVIKLAADSIVLMNRIVSRLFDETSLVNGTLGLAEWSILRELAVHPEFKVGTLTKRLGISPQRVNQLLKSMSTAKLVEIDRPAEGSRSRDIKCTALGKERAAAADKAVLELFEKAFPDNAQKLKGLRGNLKRISTALLGEQT